MRTLFESIAMTLIQVSMTLFGKPDVGFVFLLVLFALGAGILQLTVMGYRK